MISTNEELQQAIENIGLEETIEIPSGLDLFYDGPISIFFYISIEGPSKVIINGVDYGCSIGTTTSPLGKRE